MTDSKKETFIRVDDWEEKNDKERVLRYNGKLITIPFDEIFHKDKKGFNNFLIKRESYVKLLPSITKYINYFIKYYDHDDELVVAYLRLKHQIDNKNKIINASAFIKMMYGVLFTDSMKEKISKMVEDNYYISLTSPNRNEKFAESLQFTEDHARALMRISMCMKIMVPILFQYINRYNLLKKVSLFVFYEKLLYMFDDGLNIYNKLLVTIQAKIKRHTSEHGLLWSQREILGIDPLIHINTLLKDNIISDSIVKYQFNKNIVSFNSVILDSQLKFFSMSKYQHTLRELTSNKDAEGLSGLDKLEMNSAKIDESLTILSSVSIKNTIKQLKQKFGIEVTKEEVNYYMEHYKIHKFQVQLVYYFYAKYFGGFHDLNLLTKKQFIKLMILMKKRLQYQDFIYLPYLISGNIEKLVKRTIQNKKFITKLESSELYKSLHEDKFSVIDETSKNNTVKLMLSCLISSTFTCVDYDMPERLGEEIPINPDILSDEFLNFLNQI